MLTPDYQLTCKAIEGIIFEDLVSYTKIKIAIEGIIFEDLVSYTKIKIDTYISGIPTIMKLSALYVCYFL